MGIFLNFFNNSPWLNIIFLILAILGIFLAIYFYYKSIREKKPVYNTKSIPLFHANPIIANKIEIKYHGTVVNNLTLTKFAFWNAGLEPIRFEDIPNNFPFLLKTSNDVIIYDIELLDQNTVNNFSVKKLDEHTIKIDFDFINFNDGIIINIFHSKYQKTGLTLQAKFIGAKQVARGIQKDKLADKMDVLARPINYFFNKKGISSKIIFVLLFLPSIAVIIPLSILILPIDYFMNKANNNFERKFFLID